MCISGFCSHDLGNQAKLLSVAGKAEAASELFSQALRTALECVRMREAEQPRGAEAQSALFMCEVIHARVLKLAADFDEVQGLADAAKEKRKEAERIEALFGFFSQ